MTDNINLQVTALEPLHRALGARMVPFAGYSMPVQYPSGIIQEHLHTRSAAGLFDVSHMGQVIVSGPHAAQELESIMPADLLALPPLRATYSLLTNTEGGVCDDLIVTRLDDHRFLLVLNAACKHSDLALIQAACTTASVEVLEKQALLALQGPAARPVLSGLMPGVNALSFMQAGEFNIEGIRCWVSCSGYTGEDGFELSVANDDAESLARLLLNQPQVAAIGLGARDSLRLEAGLCLYGHELTDRISPVGAGLRWAIARARRPGGDRAGGYPGADQIAYELSNGTEKKRVGLKVAGKRPVREGQAVHTVDGALIGTISSGGFGPSVGAPVAMAFVDASVTEPGTEFQIDVRGTWITAHVIALPMIAPGYHRG